MGVQDVVARLNKSKSANTSSKHGTGQVPKKKIVMPSSHESHKFPPSPIPSPTSTMHNYSTNNSNTTAGSNNIASMLQKFGQSAQPPKQQTRQPKSPQQPPLPQQSRSTSPRQSPLPRRQSPLPRRQSPLPQQSRSTSPILPKQSVSPQQQSKLPTPPESPVISLQQQKKVKVIPIDKKNDAYIKFDTTANELVDLFQALLERNAAHEEHIKQLEQDVEKYASAATKVRDYEIRVEYLALKLEQVSEERDYFEKELNELAEKRPQQQRSSAVSLLSSKSKSVRYRPEDQHDIVIEEERKLQNQNNDAYIADILHVYEEISAEDEPANQEDMEKQLVEHDKGVQMTMMKYLADLETQRLETKNLQEIVLKQDELITKLEQKLDGQPADELLKEQVEVQRIELDNKRELLTQLLNEREDLLKRLNSQKRRSSIELISHMLQDDSVHNNHRNSYSSTSSKSSGRGTPPLTAPPKQPLPPLPPVL